MRHAFIADDEAGIRTIIRKVAEMCDFAVTECADGSQLLGSLSQAKNDSLIFLDMQMPEMDGIETVSELANLPQSCTIYLMTGGSEINAQAAKAIGIVRGLNIADTLSKPIPLQRLREIFETA